MFKYYIIKHIFILYYSYFDTIFSHSDIRVTRRRVVSKRPESQKRAYRSPSYHAPKYYALSIALASGTCTQKRYAIDSLLYYLFYSVSLFIKTQADAWVL